MTTYSHKRPHTLPGLILCATILACIPLTLHAQQELSGPQSGTLAAGVYDVIGDVSVADGHQWSLSAGVHLRFYPGTRCLVNGTLVANGAEDDSVYFTRYDEDQAWSGIDVLDYSYIGLDHTVVTGSDDNGIYCYSSILKLTHSRVSYNSDDTEEGGGIYCQSAFYDTVFYSDLTNNDGDGYYGYFVTLKLRESVIANNAGRGLAVVGSTVYCDKTVFDSNQNSAVYNGSAGVVADSCRFTNNTAANGGAVYAQGHFSATYSLFENNSATYDGGVFYRPLYGTTSVENCVLVNNTAGQHGSVFYFDASQIRNCIISNNIGDAAIYSYGNGTIPYYNIFYNNCENMLTEEPRSPVIHFEEITMVNVNGDSCDPHFNLFMDPEFDPESEDLFHLLSTSPAIDAGDPDNPHDPDSTIADIGMHYYDQGSAVWDNRRLSPNPHDFGIIRAYPNPFNSTVTIAFTLPTPSSVEMAVYTITGQRVNTISLGQRSGHQTISWTAPDGLASGVYLLRMSGGGQQASRKVVYLK
ncbi:T9SS type A sorting domain-containing protein [bacterium]|nr:T9SS type A sorting domain-containing protein [bacterium]